MTKLWLMITAGMLMASALPARDRGLDYAAEDAAYNVIKALNGRDLDAGTGGARAAGWMWSEGHTPRGD